MENYNKLECPAGRPRSIKIFSDLNLNTAQYVWTKDTMYYMFHLVKMSNYFGNDLWYHLVAKSWNCIRVQLQVPDSNKKCHGTTIFITSLKPKCLNPGSFIHLFLSAYCTACVTHWVCVCFCVFSGVCPCVGPPWSQTVAAGSTLHSCYTGNRRVVYALQTPAYLELHHHEEPRSDRTANDSGDAAPEVARRSTTFCEEVGTWEQNKVWMIMFLFFWQFWNRKRHRHHETPLGGFMFAIWSEEFHILRTWSDYWLCNSVLVYLNFQTSLIQFVSTGDLQKYIYI